MAGEVGSPFSFSIFPSLPIIMLRSVLYFLRCLEQGGEVARVCDLEMVLERLLSVPVVACSS